MRLRRVPLRTVGPVALLVVTWMTFWLGMKGLWLQAVLSATLVLIILTATLLIYQRYPSHSRSSLLLCLCIVAANALALSTVGPHALPWAYLSLMSNFFIAGRRVAALGNLILVGILLVIPGVLLGPPVNHSGIAVALLTLVFGYRFSSRLQGNHVRLEALATRDTLTGLPNRRALERALSRLLANDGDTTRFDHALLVLDIDHFKQINDRHGHAAGDTTLVHLSAVLRMELRELDQIFRFGGEEFVVLARVHSRDQLEGVAERIRTAVMHSLRNAEYPVTLSIGAAMYGGEKEWMEWFARADAALYQSKEAGRNKVTVSQD